MATIEGTLTDGFGDGIADAEVTITESGSETLEAETTTDDTGFYRATVAGDSYDVRATKFGYDPVEKTGQTVQSGETITVDLSTTRFDHKVRGRFSDPTGIGVLATNTAGSGTPIGVLGSVPDADGYGLATTDDARIHGTLDTGETDFVVEAGTTDTVDARNVVLGHASNTATSGTVGAVVGGGGSDDGGFSDRSNEVSGDYGTVSGGFDNTASGIDSTVGGGEANTASGVEATVGGGDSNTASADRATVGGGQSNTADGGSAAVGGGLSNTASGGGSAVGGGALNTASTEAKYATISGGRENTASTGASYATIGGGRSNTASTGAAYATIGGGRSNTATSGYATVAGGQSNVAKGAWATVSGGKENTASGTQVTVSGGEANTASNSATIGGGSDNTASGQKATVGGGQSNVAKGALATVSGGHQNTASGDPLTSAQNATIGGGFDNTASGQRSTVGGGRTNVASENDTTVGGGRFNTASGGGATVGGGTYNTASGPSATVGGGNDNTAGNKATVGGGRKNRAYGENATIGGGGSNRTGKSGTSKGDYATVAGGQSNLAKGASATVPGGEGNVAEGNHSFAAGRQAKATEAGTFVWNDGTSGSVTSATSNSVVVAASNGVGIGTNDPGSRLHVADTVAKNVSDPSGHVATVENESTNTDADVLLLTTNVSDPPGTTNYITFEDGGGTNIGAIEGDGSGGVTNASAGADYAEWLPRAVPEESMEPGDVVGVRDGAIRLRTARADHAMVVSDQPVVAGNDPGPEPTARQGHEQVAFVGQAPVKVRGPVEAGDLVVPSGEHDGTARAIDQAAYRPGDGPLVGRAWESDDTGGVSAVTVAVGVDDPTVVADRLAECRDRIDRLEREHDRKDDRIDDLKAENEALQERLHDIEDRLATVEGDGNAAAPADD